MKLSEYEVSRYQLFAIGLQEQEAHHLISGRTELWSKIAHRLGANISVNVLPQSIQDAIRPLLGDEPTLERVKALATVAFEQSQHSAKLRALDWPHIPLLDIDENGVQHITSNPSVAD